MNGLNNMTSLRSSFSLRALQPDTKASQSEEQASESVDGDVTNEETSASEEMDPPAPPPAQFYDSRRAILERVYYKEFPPAPLPDNRL